MLKFSKAWSKNLKIRIMLEVLRDQRRDKFEKGSVIDYKSYIMQYLIFAEFCNTN